MLSKFTTQLGLVEKRLRKCSPLDTCLILIIQNSKNYPKERINLLRCMILKTSFVNRNDQKFTDSQVTSLLNSTRTSSTPSNHQYTLQICTVGSQCTSPLKTHSWSTKAKRFPSMCGGTAINLKYGMNGRCLLSIPTVTQ